MKLREIAPDERSFVVMLNFIIYYEIDNEEVKTVLRAEEHGGDDEMSWVLLDQAENEAAGSAGSS